MRNGSPELQGVLTGSCYYHWEADLYYNGDRRLKNLPISRVEFSEDAGAMVQQSGSCTVVWSDEFATSISPRYVTDPLAPFGAQLHVYCVVTAGPFRERVEYGWFEITDVPSARDERMRFRSQWITTGSVVELELKELFAGIGEESFAVPEAPASLSSAWAEITRLAGLPVQQTIDDAPIPRSVMYEGSPLDAIYSLVGSVMLGVPHMTADGVVAARPIEWPASTADITLDVIEDVGEAMSAADVFNRVVVLARSGDDTTILADKKVESGPLRAQNSDGSRSPFRVRTKTLSSEFVTTRAQAEPWAEAELAQVSTPRARVVPVVELFNPLRERGDVVRVERHEKWLVGRVATIDRRGGTTQELSVEIGSEMPKE